MACGTERPACFATSGWHYMVCCPCHSGPNLPVAASSEGVRYRAHLCSMRQRDNGTRGAVVLLAQFVVQPHWYAVLA